MSNESRPLCLVFVLVVLSCWSKLDGAGIDMQASGNVCVLSYMGSHMYMDSISSMVNGTESELFPLVKIRAYQGRVPGQRCVPMSFVCFSSADWAKWEPVVLQPCKRELRRTRVLECEAMRLSAAARNGSDLSEGPFIREIARQSWTWMFWRARQG